MKPWEKYQEGPWAKYVAPQESAPSGMGQGMASEASTRQAVPEAPKMVPKTPGILDIPGTFRPGSEPEKLGSFSDLVAQGASAGASDEAYAAAAAPIAVAAGKAKSYQEAYDKILKEQRDKIAAYRERQPFWSGVAELVGGLTTGGRLQEAGVSLLKHASPGLISMLWRSGVEGAGYGAAYGLGQGEGGLAERAASAGKGALIGGVAGAGLGAAGYGVGRALAPKPADSGAALVSRALGREGITPAELPQKLAPLGPEGMIADIGPNLQQQAGGMVAMPGEAQATIQKAIASRASGASGRITAATNKALGLSKNLVAEADKIISDRATVAGPLYDQAFKANQSVESPAIYRILQTPAGKQAMREAVKTMRNDMSLVAKPDAEMTAALKEAVENLRQPQPRNLPGGKVAKGYYLRTLDYVKQALWDLAESNRNPRTGAETAMSRAIKKQWKVFVNELDRLDVTAQAGPNSVKPEGGLYAQGRRAFAGPSRILDAMKEGQNVFKNSVHPDQLAKDIGALSGGEKEAFIAGARGAIDDIMGTARSDANAAKALFEKGYNQEKLRLILGKPDADALLQALEAERAFTGSQRVITQNSLTSSREAAKAELGAGQQPSFGVREGYITGGARGAVRGTVVRTAEKLLNKRLGEAAARKAAATNAEAAKILTATGTDRDAAVQRLAQFLQSQGGRQISDRERAALLTAIVSGSQQKLPAQ